MIEDLFSCYGSSCCINILLHVICFLCAGLGVGNMWSFCNSVVTTFAVCIDLYAHSTASKFDTISAVSFYCPHCNSAITGFLYNLS